VHFATAAGGTRRQLCLDGGRAVCVEKVEDVRLTWARPAGAGGAGGAGSGHRDVADDKVFVDVVRYYGSVHEDDCDVRAGRSDDAMVARVMASPTITERRTLVFLTAPAAPLPPQGSEHDGALEAGHPRKPSPPPPSSRRRTMKEGDEEEEEATTRTDIAHEIVMTPSPALLFRFSALTFNAHAIHLDPQHCAAAEGYRARLVHGPLLLVLMFSALRGALEGSGTAVTALDYRNLEPLYVGEELRVRVAPGRTRWNVWVEGPGGRLCVKGSAQVA
jgi:hydroxyacyl-ACP dehydratase HTD2-like protein with hotdog domain